MELRAWQGAICTVTPRRERESDNTRLPRASINAAPWRLHARFRMSSTYRDVGGNAYGKKHTKDEGPPRPLLEISNKRWNKSFVPELTAQAIDSALNHMLSQGTVPFKMAAHFYASLRCDELKAEIQLIQV